jgi:hypothetical protein
MDQKRDAEVELYRAFSVEEILERREMFTTGSSTSRTGTTG